MVEEEEVEVAVVGHTGVRQPAAVATAAALLALPLPLLLLS